MDEGMGPIPASLVCDAAPGDIDVAEEVARRLLSAVRTSVASLDIVRISGDGDVRSFRIEVAGSRYHATITENAVIEKYSIDRLRSTARRRLDARPVLIELMHVFTVHDAEGAVVSASDSVPPGDGVDGSVFGQLFDAARGASTAKTLAAARAR